MPSLGKVGLVNKGTYSSSEIYNTLDFVLYDGSSYICLRNGVTGITPNTDGINWNYLAKGYITNTEVFVRKADMKTSLTTTYSAGQYAADASTLKTLNDKITAVDNRVTTVDGKIKTYTGTSPISVSGTAISLAVSGAVNATTSFGETGNKTPAFGGTFKVPSFTVDKWGRLTVAADHNVTIPSLPAVEVGTITWNSAITTTSNESVLYKVGNICIIKVNFLSSSVINDYTTIATVPNGFKPRDIAGVNACPNYITGATTAEVPVIRIGTSGAVQIMKYNGPVHLGIRADIMYVTS